MPDQHEIRQKRSNKQRRFMSLFFGPRILCCCGFFYRLFRCTWSFLWFFSLLLVCFLSFILRSVVHTYLFGDFSASSLPLLMYYWYLCVKQRYWNKNRMNWLYWLSDETSSWFSCRKRGREGGRARSLRGLSCRVTERLLHRFLRNSMIFVYVVKVF